MGESLELKALSFLASEFKKIILAANQKRYLIVFDSKRETEGKSRQVLDEILAKLKNKSKLKICAEEEGRVLVTQILVRHLYLSQPCFGFSRIVGQMQICTKTKTNANMYKDKDKDKHEHK